MQNDRLPPHVDKVMRCLGDLLDSKLPRAVEAVYVYGSSVLNGFVEGSSDIDFLAVLSRSLSDEEEAVLRTIHRELEERWLRGTDLMGAYVERDRLEQPRYTYYETMFRTDLKGADLNPVTWWVLRRHGIQTYGAPQTLLMTVSSEELKQYVLQNMNTYWVRWIDRTAKLGRMPWSFAVPFARCRLDFVVEWCVLGMLRQWYTIREDDVVSKPAAGEYGLARVPQQWQGLIREAIALKRRQPYRFYSGMWPWARLKAVTALLRYIHQESNNGMEGERSLPLD